MSLQARIDSAYKNALKSHEAMAVETYRMMKSAVKNAEIEARHELSDDETVAVLAREAKRRRESMGMFTAANRDDLAAHEQDQLTIIETFLPSQLSDDELKAAVEAVIAAQSATARDFGKVMGAVVAATKGRADGGRISAIVKTLLK